MPAAINLSVDADISALQQKIDRFAANVKPIKLNFDTGGNQGLGTISRDLGQFNKSLDAASARVLAFTATVGAIRLVQNAFTEMIKASIEVEKSLTDINVILGVGGEKLKTFGDQLFDIAKNTGQSFDTVAKAATDLVRQGLGMEETLRRTNDALILSRLSGLDAAESVSTLTAAINSFSKSALTSTEIVNKFANVDAAFAVSSADLAEALKRVGSTAQDAGVNFDQLLGVITAVQQTTSRGGAVIGNALKSIFARISRPESIEQLKALGVAIDDNQNGIQKLKAISDATKGVDVGTATLIKQIAGGVFQVNQLSAALSNLGSKYDITAEATKKSATATNEAIQRNKELNETFSAQFNRLVQNAKQTGASIGSGAIVNPFLKSTVGVLNDALEGINSKDSNDIGSKIGKGLVEGIGQYITEPGALLLGVGIGKIFLKVANDISAALKSLLNIDSQLSSSLNNTNSTFAKSIGLTKGIKDTRTQELDIERQILQTIDDQNASLGFQSNDSLKRTFVASQVAPLRFNSKSIEPSIFDPTSSPRLNQTYERNLYSDFINIPVYNPFTKRYHDPETNKIVPNQRAQFLGALGPGFAQGQALNSFKQAGALSIAEEQRFQKLPPITNNILSQLQYSQSIPEAEASRGVSFGNYKQTASTSLLSSLKSPNSLLGISIAAPLIASVFDSLNGGDDKESRVRSARNSAIAQTISLGATGGILTGGNPLGIVGGAALGGVTGGIGYLNARNTDLPEFQAALKKATETLNITNDALSRFFVSSNKLTDIFSGRIQNVSVSELNQIQSEKVRSFQAIPADLRGGLLESLRNNEGDDGIIRAQGLINNRTLSDQSRRAFSASAVGFSEGKGGILPNDIVQSLLGIQSGDTTIGEKLVNDSSFRNNFTSAVNSPKLSSAVPPTQRNLFNSLGVGDVLGKFDKNEDQYQKILDALRDYANVGIPTLIRQLDLLKNITTESAERVEKLSTRLGKLSNINSDQISRLQTSTQEGQLYRQLVDIGQFRTTSSSFLSANRGQIGPGNTAELESFFTKELNQRNFDASQSKSTDSFSLSVLNETKKLIDEIEKGKNLINSESGKTLANLAEKLSLNATNPTKIEEILKDFSEEVKKSNGIGLGSENVQKVIRPIVENIQGSNKELQSQTRQNTLTKESANTTANAAKNLATLLTRNTELTNFGGGLSSLSDFSGAPASNSLINLNNVKLGKFTNNPSQQLSGLLGEADTLKSFGENAPLQEKIVPLISKVLSEKFQSITGKQLPGELANTAATFQYNAKFNPEGNTEQLKRDFDEYEKKIKEEIGATTTINGLKIKEAGLRQKAIDDLSKSIEANNILRLSGGLLSSTAASENLAKRREQILLNPNFNTSKGFSSTFSDSLKYGTQDFKTDLVNAAAEFGTGLKSSFSTAFKEFASGQKNAQDALKSFAISFATTIQNKIIDVATSSLFSSIPAIGSLFSSGSSSSTFSRGGSVGRYASGGVVTGGSGIVDDVPLMLSAGDYVLNKRATANLQNSFDFNDPHYPTGGALNVSSSLSAFGQNDPNNPQNAVKFTKEQNLFAYLQSKASYDSQKAAALKAFQQGKDQQFISALLAPIGLGAVAGLKYSSAAAGRYNSAESARGAAFNYQDLPDTSVGAVTENIAATGGMISPYGALRGFASGGSSSDNIPALLTAGERIIPKSVVNKYGRKFFDDINSGRINKFAVGGSVGISNADSNSSINTLIAAIQSLKDSLNNSKNTSTTSNPNGGMVVNSTVNINIDKNGNTQATNTASTQNSSNDNKNNSNSGASDSDNAKKLSKLMQDVALQTIIQQQRNGGLLAAK